MNALELALRVTAPACKTCNDIRMIEDGTHGAKLCPKCGPMDKKTHIGPMDEVQYRIFRARHMAEVTPMPQLEILDLTIEELAFFKQQIAGYDGDEKRKRKIIVLGWIEGRRYDPSKDEDFVALVNERVAAERRKMEEKHADLPTR